MTERTFIKAQELFSKLDWLKDIHTRYVEILEKFKHENAVIDFIHFRTNVDSEDLRLNPHRSIDNRFIIEALEDVLAKLKAEIITTQDTIEKL